MPLSRAAASAPTKPSSAEPRGGLPGQAEEVQPRDGGGTCVVPDVADLVEHACDVQPRVVGPVTGGPHDRVDVGGAAVGEAGGASGASGQPGPEVEAAPAQASD